MRKGLLLFVLLAMPFSLCLEAEAHGKVGRRIDRAGEGRRNAAAEAQAQAQALRYIENFGTRLKVHKDFQSRMAQAVSGSQMPTAHAWTRDQIAAALEELDAIKGHIRNSEDEEALDKLYAFKKRYADIHSRAQEKMDGARTERAKREHRNANIDIPLGISFGDIDKAIDSLKATKAPYSAHKMR